MEIAIMTPTTPTIQPLLQILSSNQIPRSRRRAIDPETLKTAATILSDIESRGDQAVLEHAIRLGDLQPGAAVLHNPEALRAARDRIPIPQRYLLERTAARIQKFAMAQKACMQNLDVQIDSGMNYNIFEKVENR